MTVPDHSFVGEDQRVTASELVRQFGIWQERAARAPIYVLHRGRPRLVLTSIEVMEALCAPGPKAHDGRALEETLALVLDARDDPTIVTGRDGRITRLNRAARARFGGEIAIGAPAGTIAAAGGDLLAGALARVLADGYPETVEIVPQRFTERRHGCAIEPLPDGALLTFVDVSTRRALAEAHAAAVAACEAGTAAGVIRVDITPRGQIPDPSPALVAAAGIARESLAALPFASLFDAADRIRIGEAVEAAADGGAATPLDAWLLVRGDRPRPVRLGIAGVCAAGRIDRLVATIVPSMRIAPDGVSAQ